MAIEIAVLKSGDEGVLANVAPDVFDDAIDMRATKEFLADHRHHLVVAVEDGVVVGFASAVHYVHPDKSRPELWINEVGVAPTHRGQGVAASLLRALLEVGHRARCTEAWVLTDRSNAAAMRLYGSVGGVEDTTDTVMFTFPLGSHSSS